MIHDLCGHFFEVFCELHHFFIMVFLVGFHLLLVGYNFGFRYYEIFTRLVIYLVLSFSHIEA